MTTARDWLVSKGLAKPGRGKFSKAAHAELNKAIASGTKFSDYPKAEKVVKKTTVAAKPKAPTNPMPEVLFPDEWRYPEDEYRAVSRSDGKKHIHSMREVCNNCRVSLVMCHCETPTIYGSIQVKIERV